MKPGMLVPGLALIGVLGFASFGILQPTAAHVIAQSGGMSTQHKQGQGSTMDMQQMMNGMTSMQRKMMAHTKEADAQLDRLVSEMDAAKGQTKVDAMADLLKTLVKQREQMQQQYMQMDGQMMNSMNMMDMMMGHMMSGKGGGD